MDTLDLDVDARGIATLRLSRPEKRNAMDAAMIAELTQAADRLGHDPAVRAVVLTGAGETFCAGGDLAWMKAQIGADAAQRSREAGLLAEMLRVLNQLPKPLIGRVQGNAFGGGLGLISVCDLAIGVQGARFGLTEVRLGLIPATIGPYVIDRIGAAKAREVFFAGRLFDAQDACRLGFLARVVPQDALDAAIETEIEPILSAAPGAVAAGKRLVQELSGGVDDTAVARSIDALVTRWESPESAEGIAAFFEKRAPEWKI